MEISTQKPFTTLLSHHEVPQAIEQISTKHFPKLCAEVTIVLKDSLCAVNTNEAELGDLPADSRRTYE